MRCLTLLSSLLLLVSLAPAQQAYSFSAYPDNNGANYVAVADFNRDGYPDVIIGSGSNTIDIFLNDHTGHFPSYTSYSVPSLGKMLAVDVNGDGWPDLVIASGTNNTVLINNGNATFHVGTTLVTRTPANSFVAGDFNKDGKVDLAALEGKQIEILKNNGSGVFTSGQVLAMSGGPSNAVVEDFDNDGNLDIGNTEGSKTLIWWGKGDGTFGAPLQIAKPTADSLTSITAADFNNDGRVDFAVSSTYYNGCSNPEDVCGYTTAHVYKNLGGRSFSLASSFKIGDDLGGIFYSADLTGDLNYDLVDLINAAGVSSGDISFRPGTGNMTFGTEQMIDGDSTTELAFRDLNNDSRTDIIIPSYFPDGELIVGLASNGYKNCSGLGSLNLAAKICTPAASATVTSPVLVRAAGNSPLGVKRLEIWVDGVKQYQKLGDQLAHKLTLSPGSHRLTVVAVDKYSGTSSKVETINVQ